MWSCSCAQTVFRLRVSGRSAAANADAGDDDDDDDADWPHSHYHSLHSHNPVLQLQLLCDCMLGMENIINNLHLCQREQPTHCLCSASIWAQTQQQQQQQHKQLRVFGFRGKAVARRSRGGTVILRNGGGGSALFSLMDCRLLREDALWCGQEELWESTPREARGGGCVCLFKTHTEEYLCIRNTNALVRVCWVCVCCSPTPWTQKANG